jgi:hypothetical protein
MPSVAVAADFPAPKRGEWIAQDFKCLTGEVLPEVNVHYTTVGAPVERQLSRSTARMVRQRDALAGFRW